MNEMVQPRPQAQTGGSIKDEGVCHKIFTGAPLRAGGIPISEDLGMFNSSRRCRFPIAGSGLEMMICAEPATRNSYCANCYEIAYYGAAKRATDKVAAAVSRYDRKDVIYAEDKVMDLCGNVVG